MRKNESMSQIPEFNHILFTTYCINLIIDIPSTRCHTHARNKRVPFDLTFIPRDEGIAESGGRVIIMSSSLRTSPWAAAYYELMRRRLLPLLPSWGLTPDRLTWIGMLASVVVPLGFWVHPIWGFVLILFSGLADSIDGLMARQQDRLSSWGAFLDSSLDRVSDFFYLLGFWVMLTQQTGQVPATLSIFFSILLTTLISYTKARAEALGCNCPAGLMERGVRTIYLIVWALLIVVLPSGSRAGVLWSGLVLYGGLTFLTVFQRWTHIQRQLTNSRQP